MNDVCVVVHCCIYECGRIITAISRLSIISLLSFTCFLLLTSTHSTAWREWCLCCCSLLHTWVSPNYHHSNQLVLNHQSILFFLAFLSTHSTAGHESCLCCCSLLHIWVSLNHPYHSNQPALYHQSTFFAFTSTHSTAVRNDVCVVVHCCIFECGGIITAISRLSVISLLSFTCFHVNPLYSMTWMTFVLLFIAAYMSVARSSS